MTALWTDAWAEAQASVPGDKVELLTLELLHPSFLTAGGQPDPLRAVRDTQDHVLTLEDTAPLDPGGSVNFTAIMFDMPWPEVEEGRVPSLQIKIDNIGREMVPYLKAAARLQTPITVILRSYIFDVPTSAAVLGADPITFQLRNVTVNDTAVIGSASPADLANIRAFREVYDIERFPGLDAQT